MPNIEADPNANSAGAQLLFVEDDDVDAERVHRWIQRLPQKWTIHRAHCLSDAVKIIGSHSIDLALVDLTLPDADGLTAVETIRQAAPNVIVIVVTNVDDADGPTSALNLGAEDFLLKDSMTQETLERSIRYSIARSRAQAELIASSTELAKSDEELNDFANVVAHDLRAPVRTARLLADRLVATIENPPELTADLGLRLDDALARVDTMILSILDYSALRGQVPDPVSTDLLAVGTDSVLAVDADLKAASATVEITFDEPVWVASSPDLLRRVLVNLLSNSIKYRRHHVPLHIAIEALERDETVEVRIADNGIGIPDQDRDRVFRILERLDPNACDGLGFGLPICRRILTEQGATISVEPTAEHGTTILLTFQKPDRHKRLPATLSEALGHQASAHLVVEPVTTR